MQNTKSNLEELSNAFLTVIKAFDDEKREGLIDTPLRAAKAMIELLSASEPVITTFDSKGYSELIHINNVKFYSLCEHHLLPFFGEVNISYIPNERIIGLSKIPRIVEYLSKRLNTQEYFTDNIANYLQKVLNPLYLEVNVSGRHMCMEMRGVKKEGVTFTKAVRK